MWYLSIQNRALEMRKAADLVAAVVEDQGAPILVFALLGIGMGIQLGAVEEVESGPVLGKVGGDPIEDNADAGGMTLVDKKHKVFGGAKAGSRGKKPQYLVAPGTVKGMLGDGQHFDMRVAHLLDIGDKGGGQFAVGEVTLAPLVIGSPCARSRDEPRRWRWGGPGPADAAGRRSIRCPATGSGPDRQPPNRCAGRSSMAKPKGSALSSGSFFWVVIRYL